MNIDELQKLINHPHETSSLEFKEAKSQFDMEKLFKYCVALANERGGHLILGVADKHPRSIVGTQEFRNLEKIKSKIFATLHFRVEVEEFLIDDKRVLVFIIPSRPNGSAYSYEGAYYMRVGEELRPMTEDVLRQIFSEDKGNALLAPASETISPEKVLEFLDTHAFFELLNMPYPADSQSVVNRLKQEALIVSCGNKWKITKLGALLFARDIKLFDSLQRKAPRVIVYSGKNKIDAVREIQGTKGYAVGFKGLIAYIIDLLPTNELIQNALRVNTAIYPTIAIRELVANALIHQDIEDTSSFVMIEIFSDRMEISNPGKPLIDTDRFIDEYKTRNEKLADLMRRMGICEERSSGIDKTIYNIETWQLPAPDFQSTPNHTKVILYSYKSFDDMDSAEKIRACYQHCCLLHVSGGGRMTNQSLRERFKLPEHKADVISRIITDTVSHNLIKIDNPEKKSRRYAKYIPYWG